MSLSKKIERNLDEYLSQFEGQLQPNWRSLPFSQKNLIANMSRNGITPADLERAKQEGIKEAYQRTAPALQSVMYCAMCVVLHDSFGFDHDQCYQAVVELDKMMLDTIDNDEIKRDCEEKTGVRIDVKEGVGRIVEVDY